MKDILLILVLSIYAIWGYRMMERLDRFLNEHVKSDIEDEENDQHPDDGI